MLKNWASQTHLIQSYLKNRQQAVWIHCILSEFITCNIGVPQGSNLGPLFFNVYFNDLLFALDCDVENYADDTTLTPTGKSINEISEKLGSSEAKDADGPPAKKKKKKSKRD